jgi:hypothetical protein
MTITVADTTAPALALTAPLVLEATGPSGAVATFAAQATDVHDGALPVTCSAQSGDTFALGATEVSCSATDVSGNTAQGSFTVTVRDTTAPVVTAPADVTAVAAGGATIVGYGAASASDIVDGALVATCAPPSGSAFAPGTTTVLCSATDAAGNTGSASFRVHVAFSWSGFLAPINADGSSLWRGGRTVPVKFQLTGASAGYAGLTARLYVARVSSGVIGTEEEVASTSSADTGNTFRYSASDDHYIFNLATRGFADGTYQLRADLGDGTSRTVLVSVRR